MNITLLEAENLISRAKVKANQLNVYMNIAVVDAGANLLAFARMDGAVLGAIDIAIKKAKTARLFNKETGILGEMSQPNGPLFNIEHSNGGLITFPGGIPIKNVDGNIIGAIGISGGSIENDFLVAEYAVALFQ